ncbi:MAG: hypothetical protein ACLFRB_03065 [Thiohalorhabdus sp.]|uniref:hypothetical protein n=1 Tax=Thiohalorhabdus sp. TaxID=3094134 RepID=UPI003980E402
MSGHELPFEKRVDRNAMHSFFEYHGFDEELEEEYYRFLYDFVLERMEKDNGLKAAFGPTFQHYPHGQHHGEDFHLHGHKWAVRTADLGNFIGKTAYLAMPEEEKQEFARRHEEKVAELSKKAEQKPKEETDDIPAFRHT